jgi:hypothetical protein
MNGSHVVPAGNASGIGSGAVLRSNSSVVNLTIQGGVIKSSGSYGAGIGSGSAIAGG